MSIPAATVDLSPIDFNGKQVMELSETIFTSIFKNPALSDVVTLVTNIKAKQQVVILGLLGLVGKTKSGNQCAPDASTQTIPSIQKYWNPNQIEDRFVNCWKDLLAEFWVWGLKNGIDKADLTGTDFALFLDERITTAEMEGVYRLVYFGDTAVATVANSGTLKNGTDITYFNGIDGVWKQLYAIATEFPANKIAIAKNAGNSYVNQKFTHGIAGSNTDVGNQVITGILQDMIDGADTRLTEDPGAQFWVTKSVADQYKRERKVATNVEMAYTRTETGIQQLEFDGYKINVMPVWDRNIKAYFDNGTTTYLPHRIIFTTKENVQVGIEQEANLQSLEAFYDKRDKNYYVDLAYSIDAMVVEDYKVMMAY